MIFKMLAVKVRHLCGYGVRDKEFELREKEKIGSIFNAGSSRLRRHSL